MEKQTFYVGGMTCAGCERTLERAVLALKGARQVKADCVKGKLETDFEPPCRAEQIRAAIAGVGYQPMDRPQSSRNAVYILIILLGLYVIAGQLGWTAVFQAFPVIGPERVGYLAMFLIGLLTSVHCIAMCGGLNLGQSVTGSGEHPLARSVLYNLGRLVSYTAIGGVLGLVGQAAAITLRLRGLIGLIAGAFMVLMGANMLGHFGFLRQLHLKLPAPLVRALAAIGAHGPFNLGLVNGLMPCGPLQSMQLYAVASGGFWAGALSMFFFCLGTIPLVLLFGVTAGLLRKGQKDKMLQASACLLVLFGLFMAQNNLALLGVALPTLGGGGGAAVSAAAQGEVQRLTTYLRPNGYEDIQVTVGVPVEWTIIAEAGSLNGCNNEIVLPAFGQQIKLTEGENRIAFTPEETGEFPYSCWMGMLRNTIVVTE